MSRRTFTRRFREATGTTVIQWLNAQRVARAQQLLETTDMPIEAVAGAAGLGPPLGLRPPFGAQLGTTPSHYRRPFDPQSVRTGQGVSRRVESGGRRSLK